MIACYADDGRIAVNAELCAASRVYAAGSVAKYANAISGHALVAGEGPVDATVAGRVAALNMSRDYHERSASHIIDGDCTIWSFATESLPMWRSDRCHYAASLGSQEASRLDDIGIQALCVGNCDAERMTTYGFWWTNTAAQQRVLSKRNTERNSSYRQSRYQTGRRPAPKMKPVYGVGVVFYLDDAENVKGVMLWGLPYSTEPRGEIKKALIDHIKRLLSINGSALRQKWEEGVTYASSSLAEESERVVAIALGSSDGSLKRHRTLMFNQDKRLPKPLCRYTPAKTAEIATYGFLKRRDRLGMGLLGEDIYMRREDENFSPTISRAAGLGWGDLEDARIAVALYENEMKARPPKEDPLWLRLGDANRGISSADALAQKFYANLYQGRFADGSDPLVRRRTTIAPMNPSEDLNSDDANVSTTSSQDNKSNGVSDVQ
jgi:hypothetical protein